MGHTQQRDANTARLVGGHDTDDVGALAANAPRFVVDVAAGERPAGHARVEGGQRRKHAADAPTTPKEEERIPRGDRRVAVGLCTLNLVVS